MALGNKEYNYASLAQIINGNISIALFPQIRDAITRRMQEIYGGDIDISDASADGQYVMMESLIINNIYQIIQNVFDNINPSVASGKYLDILCSLSNVRRKTASYSTANLTLRASQSNVSLIQNQEFSDRAGLVWKYKGAALPLDTNADTIVEVECETIGPVTAQAGTCADWSSWNTDNNGWIFQTVNANSNIKVWQRKNAVAGLSTETDASLRSRRYNYLGSNAMTITESLTSNLFNLPQIKDVYVFNNNTSSTQTLADDQSVPSHNVYVALRYKDDVSDTNDNNPTKTIGEVIYNQLTPGVVTEPYGVSASAGTAKTYSRPTNQVSSVVSNFNWKKCEKQSPTIVITFNTYPSAGYIEGTGQSESEKAIISSLENYIDNIKITENMSRINLQQAMLSGDLKPKGIQSLLPTACTINSLDADYTNKLSYFKYNTYTFSYSSNVGTLTITHS